MIGVIKKNQILSLSIFSYLVLFVFKPGLGIKGLGTSMYYFKEMIEILPAVFILTSLIQTWVPTEMIVRNFGNGSGLKGKLISFAIGSLSAGPLYAAFPISKMLLSKGASIENITIILGTWAVIKVPMLVNETKFLGGKYMVVRWLLTMIVILVMSYLMNKMIKPEDIPNEEMSSHLQINQKACIGCGICARMYPEIFILTDRKARFKTIEDHQIYYEQIKKAEVACPVMAITSGVTPAI